MLSRTALASMVILLIVAGCAAAKYNLAQELAWEQWEKCKQYPVSLQRITTEGQIWVTYTADHRMAFNAWNECIQKARAEQGRTRTGVAGVTPPAPAGQLTVVADMATPVWNVGDEWAYRYEGPTGTGTYVWSVDREEAIDGILHYVIKTGTREIFYRKHDFAFSRETVDGAIVLKSTPSRFHYVWPMHVGKAWEQTVLEERPVARQTSERVDAVTVEAEETVTVPAGTFRALKIVVRNRKTGAMRVEAWYSPELKQVVKLRKNLETGLRVRELIAYKQR